eukprot:6506810-Karenia_brevis.AAC.1
MRVPEQSRPPVKEEHVVKEEPAVPSSPVSKSESPEEMDVSSIASQEETEESFVQSLANQSIEELKEMLHSMTRQQQAIRDLQDKRSIKLQHSLAGQISQVRHAITRAKPPGEQISILEAVVERKNQELKAAKSKRD